MTPRGPHLLSLPYVIIILPRYRLNLEMDTVNRIQKDNKMSLLGFSCKETVAPILSSLSYLLSCAHSEVRHHAMGCHMGESRWQEIEKELNLVTHHKSEFGNGLSPR
jgi:hypothetical protein